MATAMCDNFAQAKHSSSQIFLNICNQTLYITNVYRAISRITEVILLNNFLTESSSVLSAHGSIVKFTTQRQKYAYSLFGINISIDRDVTVIVSVK